MARRALYLANGWLWRSDAVRTRPTRRAVLRIGSLSLLGLSLPELLWLRSSHGQGSARRQNSCVFFFLFGGPSHIDLWDMKPSAPAEVRGEFQPISTCVPGIQVCEHLPLLARQMDKLCLIRSMTHQMNVHGPACSELFTGRPYFGAPTTDQADPQDWPSLSSMVHRFYRRRTSVPPSVVLPWYLQFPGQARRIAGQTGGRMGEKYNALLVEGDSETLRFRVDGLKLRPHVPLERIAERRRLLDRVDAGSVLEAGALIQPWQQFREQAYELLMSRAAQWLDTEQEPDSVRDRYGRTVVGQSLLMARRLVEAGVALVTVNWEDETKIDGANTCWDTHQDNFPKLKNLLCPIFDKAFSAFLEDLHQRGLLETTLVVAVGEFGRTPRLGQFSQSSNTRKTGRDHWPNAFTALVAGGGIRGGQVYGSSNAHGAFVEENPVSPADLAATILEHLGIDPKESYRDTLRGTRYRLSEGTPIRGLG
ncbi:MAG: hypothetical protein KatS3mg110_2789 [Pirellulaceae bacterium]|nr:MAG: hypothetical protein KatS3mg110_2789 [Pirellulaceae bacterium]